VEVGEKDRTSKIEQQLSRILISRRRNEKGVKIDQVRKRETRLRSNRISTLTCFLQFSTPC